MLKENYIESRIFAHDIMAFSTSFYPNLLNIITSKRDAE